MSRAEILKKIFGTGTKALRRRGGEVTKIPKGGLKEATLEELEYLFKGKKDKLYRYDRAPEELYEGGFNLNREAHNFPEYDMVPGLYFGKDRDLVDTMMSSIYWPNRPKINVRGYLDPKAKVSENPNVWEYNKKHQGDPDALARTLMGDHHAPDEVTVLKPGKVLAQIDIAGKKLYRILSLLAALGAGADAHKPTGEEKPLDTDD